MILMLVVYGQSFKTRPGGQPGPRLGFRVLAGSPGLIGSAESILKKKNQNDVVLVKKKQKSTGLSPGLDRVSRVTPGFFFPRFFVNPAQFRPRVDLPGRAGFQNYVYGFLGMRFYLKINISFHLMLNCHLHLYLFCLDFMIPQQ
jgi:hypothetical protein